jgi:WhiB family redox-sensing transcriptional regulator
MEPYPLPARPLPPTPAVAPIVDLRALGVDVAALGGLSAWSWCVEYVRRGVADTANGDHRIVDDDIKCFDTATGSDHEQLARVLAALDDGRAVAFYGWWPTSEMAAVSDILGVDAMDVPPPDRKGAGLADGHAVVAVGYGRHAAFPGGGYLIVRNPWANAGWGDGGDGYMPFTYVRAYAIALRTCTAVPATEGEPDRDRLLTQLADRPVDRLIAERARCYDPRSSYTALFFSEDPVDVIRAKAICARCTVREACLTRALQRREPYGVWGGEFVYEGQIVALKRGRGRPRKIPLPTDVDEITGMPVVA